VLLGARVKVAFTVCAVMAFGLLALGKVPTAWSGRPLALSRRELPLHDQLAVLVAFTDALVLSTLLLRLQSTPAVSPVAVLVPAELVLLVVLSLPPPPPQACSVSAAQAAARAMAPVRNRRAGRVMFIGQLQGARDVGRVALNEASG
jgi:hypothetical protein